MNQIVKNYWEFIFYPEVLHAANVVFQNLCRPCGLVEKTKSLSESKQNLYSLKMKVCEVPIVRAIEHSKRNPGATANLKLFQSNIS